MDIHKVNIFIPFQIDDEIIIDIEGKKEKFIIKDIFCIYSASEKRYTKVYLKCINNHSQSAYIFEVKDKEIIFIKKE